MATLVESTPDYPLYGEPNVIMHSPGLEFDRLLQGEAMGATEVFAPVDYLLAHWPKCQLVLPCRDTGDWLMSCCKCREKSIVQGWNHPLWRYPARQWEVYRYEYHIRVVSIISKLPRVQAMLWKIPRTGPTWQPLCDFLRIPEPNIPFPNLDWAFGRTDMCGNPSSERVDGKLI